MEDVIITFRTKPRASAAHPYTDLLWEDKPASSLLDINWNMGKQKAARQKSGLGISHSPPNYTPLQHKTMY